MDIGDAGPRSASLRGGEEGGEATNAPPCDTANPLASAGADAGAGAGAGAGLGELASTSFASSMRTFSISARTWASLSMAAPDMGCTVVLGFFFTRLMMTSPFCPFN